MNAAQRAKRLLTQNSIARHKTEFLDTKPLMDAMKAKQVRTLKPESNCPFCLKLAIVELTDEQKAQQPDGTTHVCHPMLGGCNHGFAKTA